VDPPDNFDDFLDDIQPMTPEEQREMLLRYFALQICGVDRATLLATRAHVQKLPEEPERETLIEVIDGQLALREIERLP